MRSDQTTATGRARVLAAVVALSTGPRAPTVKTVAAASGVSRNYTDASLRWLERRRQVVRIQAGAVVRWRAIQTTRSPGDS